MSDGTFGGEDRYERPERSPIEAMRRGFLGRCPRCARGALFASFVGTRERCAACGEDFHHHRADDLPAYLVILIVGHVVVGAFMGVETLWTLTAAQHLAVWVPLTVAASLALLRPVKGAVVGLQWALYMHGFGGNDETGETRPEA